VPLLDVPFSETDWVVGGVPGCCNLGSARARRGSRIFLGSILFTWYENFSKNEQLDTVEFLSQQYLEHWKSSRRPNKANSQRSIEIPL
jgi:hypothetical protein